MYCVYNSAAVGGNFVSYLPELSVYCMYISAAVLENRHICAGLKVVCFTKLVRDTKFKQKMMGEPHKV